MANIARDHLDVIRIPRKVILAELIKKVGGSEPQYECWFEDGKYCSVARTIIATTEAETSGKLEQAMRCLEATKEGAEEEAAIALIEVLKRTYRLEIDDMNFMKRARAEHHNEQLERQLHVTLCTQNRKMERIEGLTKGWNQSLDDMNFVQVVCGDLCDGTVTMFPVDYNDGPWRDIVYEVHCLNQWLEQKIYESTAHLN